MNHIMPELVKWTPGVMLEVALREPDDFLKIRETLSRIGIASKTEESTLYQSCHILHKRGLYYIVHFKELFALDGKETDLSISDLARRNTIATLLSDWGLAAIVNWGTHGKERAPMKEIKVISHRESADWTLKTKYELGRYKGTTSKV